MTTFSLSRMPAIRKFNNEPEVCGLLTRQSWVMLRDAPAEKETYVFTRKSQTLIISRNGKVEKGRWDCLNSDTVLIESSAGAFLFHPCSLGEGMLGLQLDGGEQYALLVNNLLFEKGVRSVGRLAQVLEESVEVQTAAPRRSRRAFAREDVYILLYMAGVAFLGFEIFKLIHLGKV